MEDLVRGRVKVVRMLSYMQFKHGIVTVPQLLLYHLPLGDLQIRTAQSIRYATRQSGGRSASRVDGYQENIKFLLDCLRKESRIRQIKETTCLKLLDTASKGITNPFFIFLVYG